MEFVVVSNIQKLLGQGEWLKTVRKIEVDRYEMMMM